MHYGSFRLVQTIVVVLLIVGVLVIFSRNNELFLVTMGDRLMAAHTVTHPSFRVTSIENLFQLDLPNFVGISYDVSPDAKQFVVQTTDHTKSTSITLVTNWPAELKK